MPNLGRYNIISSYSNCIITFMRKELDLYPLLVGKGIQTYVDESGRKYSPEEVSKMGSSNYTIHAEEVPARIRMLLAKHDTGDFRDWDPFDDVKEKRRPSAIDAYHSYVAYQADPELWGEIIRRGIDPIHADRSDIERIIDQILKERLNPKQGTVKSEHTIKKLGIPIANNTSSVFQSPPPRVIVDNPIQETTTKSTLQKVAGFFRLRKKR